MQFNDLHHRMEDKDIQRTFGVDSREQGVELTAPSLFLNGLFLYFIMLCIRADILKVAAHNERNPPSWFPRE